MATCKKHPNITLNCFCPLCGGLANTAAQKAARSKVGASNKGKGKYPPCKTQKYHRWTKDKGKSCSCGIVRADYS